MAFTGNNQTIFNSAMNGALAGMMKGRPLTDATAADYQNMCKVALAFATEVDSEIAVDATLTAAGATVVPATAANQQNYNAKSHLIASLCFAYWDGRWSTDQTAGDWSVGAAAVAAAYAEQVATYANAPGGTSLS